MKVVEAKIADKRKHDRLRDAVALEVLDVSAVVERVGKRAVQVKGWIDPDVGVAVDKRLFYEFRFAKYRFYLSKSKTLGKMT